jgi:hypothetical protein
VLFGKLRSIIATFLLATTVAAPAQITTPRDEGPLARFEIPSGRPMTAVSQSLPISRPAPPTEVLAFLNQHQGQTDHEGHELIHRLKSILK